MKKVEQNFAPMFAIGKKQLVITDIYDWYDGPTFFRCIDQMQRTYLAIWIETDKKAIKYLVVRVPEGWIDCMEQGVSSAYYDMKHSPYKGSWIVRHHSSGKETYKSIKQSNITDDMLPPKDLYKKHKHLEWLEKPSCD